MVWGHFHNTFLIFWELSNATVMVFELLTNSNPLSPSGLTITTISSSFSYSANVKPLVFTLFWCSVWRTANISSLFAPLDYATVNPEESLGSPTTLSKTANCVVVSKAVAPSSWLGGDPGLQKSIFCSLSGLSPIFLAIVDNRKLGNTT